VDVLVVVPGERGAVLRVDGGGLRVGRQPVAPHVVGVGEQGAGAAGAVGQVVGLLVAAGAVLELVGAAGQGGGEGHAADVHAVAGARLEVVVLEEHRPGLGVDEEHRDAGVGGAVGPGQGDLPGQPVAGVGPVDPLLGGGGDGEVVRGDLGQLHRPGDRRLGGDLRAEALVPDVHPGDEVVGDAGD